MEILVNRESHLAAQTIHGAEGVGAGTQMGHSPQIFEGCVLFLQGIADGVAFAVDLDPGGFDLHCLTAADGLHKSAADGYAGACADAGEDGLHLRSFVHHYLDILDGASVVQRDERYLFVSSFRPYPTFGKDFLSCRHRQQVFNLRAKYFLTHLFFF